jgi:arginine/lysine/ornithine decarboxylase
MVDISAISRVCKKYGILLLVDNAHGAYLHFLETPLHPIDLGADMCCDSAHKTLPALTGAAYLHISHNAPALFHERAKDGMALFGSTSPSFLILESLDLLNPYLDDGIRQDLTTFLPVVEDLKQSLTNKGYVLVGSEPLKLTLATKSYGYTGDELAELLEARGMYCEFSDPDYLVLMLTPQNSEEEIAELKAFLLELEKRPSIQDTPPSIPAPTRVCSIREATFASTEVIPVRESLGRTLASATISCPPAVPVVMCGERIDAAAVAAFHYYGIQNVEVMK